MVVWCTQNLRRYGCSFMWHQPCQRWKYTTSVDIKKKKKKKTRYKKLVTRVESHASAVSLLKRAENSAKRSSINQKKCVALPLVIKSCHPSALWQHNRDFTWLTCAYCGNTGVERRIPKILRPLQQGLEPATFRPPAAPSNDCGSTTSHDERFDRSVCLDGLELCSSIFRGTLTCLLARCGGTSVLFSPVRLDSLFCL